MQAAFKSFRRDCARERVGPNESPEHLARFLGTPLFVRSAANGPSPLRRQFERPLWILGVDRRAGPAHRRVERREPVPGADGGAGARDGAAPVDRRRPGTADSAGARRERDRRRRWRALLGLLFAAVAGPAVVGMLTPAGDPVSARSPARLAARGGGRRLDAADDGALRPCAGACARRSVSPMTALKAGGRVRRARRRHAAVRRRAGRASVSSSCLSAACWCCRSPGCRA